MISTPVSFASAAFDFMDFLLLLLFFLLEVAESE